MMQFVPVRPTWLVAIAILLAAATSAEPASVVSPDEKGVGNATSDLEAASEVEDESDIWLEDDPLFDDEDDFEVEEFGSRDPFERTNRSIFGFNRGLDAWIFDPITRGYRLVVPAAGREALYRVSLNLDAPVEFVNHMLQFRVVGAASTSTRFLFNSTLGLGGLFDPAESFFGVEPIDADFGQTLALYGTPSGPYLMLPIFGPSTARDVFGDVVDIVVDPLSYVLGPLQWWTLALGGTEGLIVREANFDDFKRLEAGSIDFYAALRSAYLQSRDAAVEQVTSWNHAPEIATASGHHGR